jgi:hypothetical protein
MLSPKNFIPLYQKINLPTSFFHLSNLPKAQDMSLKFKKTALVLVVSRLTTKKTFKKSKKHQLLTSKNETYKD